MVNIKGVQHRSHVWVGAKQVKSVWLNVFVYINLFQNVLRQAAYFKPVNKAIFGFPWYATNIFDNRIAVFSCRKNFTYCVDGTLAKFKRACMGSKGNYKSSGQIEKNEFFSHVNPFNSGTPVAQLAVTFDGQNFNRAKNLATGPRCKWR